MIKKQYLFLFWGVIIIVILLGIFLVANSKNRITGHSVTEIVSIYKLLTENEVEVLSVKEESGLSKVIIGIKNAQGNINPQQIYITNDGKFITDKIINLEDYKKRLNNEKNFTNCLRDKGLVIVGQSTNLETMRQLNTLGAFSNRVYFDCVGDNLQKCIDIGITTIPTIIYSGQNFSGVKDLAFFEGLTGCRFGG